MNRLWTLKFTMAHIGMLYASAGNDTAMKVGLASVQEGLARMLKGPGHLPELNLQLLQNFNNSVRKNVTPLEEGQIALPGATYEGSLVYAAAAAASLDLDEADDIEKEFLKELSGFLTLMARILDQRGKELIFVAGPK